jgi:hypothetical protein
MPAQEAQWYGLYGAAWLWAAVLVVVDEGRDLRLALV